MASFNASSLAKLTELEAGLQVVLQDAIRIVPFIIIEGHRTQDQQERDFAAGKTKLHWPQGKHNALPSRAADLAPVYYEGTIMKIDWNDLIAFGRIMGAVQACAFTRFIKLRFGLDWDGDFRSVNRDPDESFLDAPHVELV